MIQVTKTWLPDKKRYKAYIDRIYKNGWVTNNGPLVRELEEKLCDYLGVRHLVLVSNGTAALEIAYRTLGLGGFAVTTPFSFVATTSSLVTNGILPIFADINPDSLTIDPEQIEAQITPHTEAIVPVHVFGRICDVDRVEEIAAAHGLKVVYDASHAFGIRYRGESILNRGDISTLSFHATKLFHTIEGGALVIQDDDLVQKARFLINFGIENEESIPELGTNAKMNEFEAAMGLCMLEDIEEILAKRQEVHKRYTDALKDVVKFQKEVNHCNHNYSYFPIILKDETQTLKIKTSLNEKNIFPRRYFYPSLDTLNYVEPKQIMPISRNISTRILALPMYAGLSKAEQDLIIKTIKDNV